ncbi:hypothetical protein GIB67_029233 [Kingdonia uniflora]|uniref:SHSP domain-containing protein n=1 Tax=Kingdonia uniflora TaxID=39325 RepID=A0A7J7N8M6_9MAGN|nr:hypothetical protein GIB67_029233 [Kingdonia uniflora]
MEFELGLKISKTSESLTSTDFRITKDRAGPLFFSKETKTMFILIVNLKGFKREKIKIKINEDGSQITISGEKPVQEIVMVRWTMYKEVEIMGFRKVFRIPHGVVLDRIKAKFNDEEAVLSVFMPKLIKGIQGVRIEEVKEEPKIIKNKESDQVGETSSLTPTVDHEKEPGQGKKLLEPMEVVSDQLSTPGVGIVSSNETQNEAPLVSLDPMKTLNVLAKESQEHNDNADTIVSPKAELEKELQEHSNNLETVDSVNAEPEQELQEQNDNLETTECAKVKPEEELQENDDNLENTESIKAEPYQLLHTEEETKKLKQEMPTGEDVPENTKDTFSKPVEPTILEPGQGIHPSETMQPQNGLNGHSEFHGDNISQAENEIQEENEDTHDEVKPQEEERHIEEAEEEESKRNEDDDPLAQTNKKTPMRGSWFCAPCILTGSAFLGLLIVLVIQLLRKNKKSKNH